MNVQYVGPLKLGGPSSRTVNARNAPSLRQIQPTRHGPACPATDFAGSDGPDSASGGPPGLAETDSVRRNGQLIHRATKKSALEADPWVEKVSLDD
jgi:hypothetical protein